MVVWIVFIIMNIVGFLLCFKDKQAAKRGKWRTAEKNFFLCGLLWGASGVFAGMLLFRHKTKHWYFVVGMPLLMAVNYYSLYKIIQNIGGITG